MTIRRLPEDVSSRIAAGEVIERPASVVKELVENALDAGADRVAVSLVQGGKTSLVVEDDGGGIPFDELPLALERYATSKIGALEDLDRIRSLGFRGEALASIATVSRLEIRSRCGGCDLGGWIRCEGGTILSCQPLPCAPGTRVQVEDLFFNLPARRKFLRAAAAETRRVAQLVQELALIHPGRTFSLASEGRRLFQSCAPGSTEAALRDHWGTEVQHLEARQGDLSARLWWSGPREGRTQLVLFVNGRRVLDGALRGALQAGAGTCGGDWLVHLLLPPEDLDVNVHPAKTEVRFRRPGEVFDLVRRGGARLVEGGTFGAPWFAAPAPPREASASPVPFAGLPRPFSESFRVSQPGGAPQTPILQTPILEGERGGAPLVSAAAAAWDVPVDPEEEPHFLGQSRTGYLVFDGPSGLWILDPHAAQERILYERLTDLGPSGAVQTLAVPVELPEALSPSVGASSAELADLGFPVAPPETEGGGWRLLGIPQVLALYPLAPLDWLRLALAQEGPQDLEALKKRVADRACKASLKLGEVLREPEARRLLRDLRSCRQPHVCPHGRPVMVSLPWGEIAGRLGRSS